MSADWDARMLGLAKHVAQWSKDPSTKVGAVICDPQYRIVSLGFNGFPRGVKDDARLEDRDTKYRMILHAERNALLFAARDLRGCRLYTWPFMPCAACAAMIIQVGITHVYAPWPSVDDPAWQRWSAEWKLAVQMFAEAGVRYEPLNAPD